MWNSDPGRNIRRNLSLFWGGRDNEGGGGSGRGRSRRNIFRLFMYLKPDEIKLKKLKKIILLFKNYRNKMSVMIAKISEMSKRSIFLS